MGRVAVITKMLRTADLIHLMTNVTTIVKYNFMYLLHSLVLIHLMTNVTTRVKCHFMYSLHGLVSLKPTICGQHLQAISWARLYTTVHQPYVIRYGVSWFLCVLTCDSTAALICYNFQHTRSITKFQHANVWGAHSELFHAIILQHCLHRVHNINK